MLSESSPFTTVTSFAGADTDGSYVQLIASTTTAYKWIVVSVLSVAGTVIGLLDISTGSAGNEVNFISDRMVASAGTTRKISHIFYFPIDEIAAGTEIRARIQDTNGGALAWTVKVMLSDQGPPVGSPTASETSTRFAVVSSATPDTYGSYVNVITSLARNTKWLLLGLGTPNTSGGTHDVEFSIGVGNPPTGTDEIDEFGFQHAADGGGESSHSSNAILIPVDFSLGDQLQIRVKDSISSARTYFCAVNALG